MGLSARFSPASLLNTALGPSRSPVSQASLSAERPPLQGGTVFGRELLRRAADAETPLD